MEQLNFILRIRTANLYHLKLKWLCEQCTCCTYCNNVYNANFPSLASLFLSLGNSLKEASFESLL